MIFRFGKDKRDAAEEDEEIEPIRFLGALHGREANLQANQRLVQAGLDSTKDLLTDALSRRAELVRIEPKGDRAAVILEIDGIKYPGGKLGRQSALAVTQMVKLLAGLDVKDRKRPQSGGIKAELDDQPYELLIDSVPLGEGRERLTVRARNLKVKLDNPEDLGFPQVMRENIRKLTGSNNGVLLCCGPPRSGTTTTKYATLRGVDSYIYSIFLVGDTEGRELFNMTVFKTEPGKDLADTFARATRNEANVLLIDPISDAETARTVFENSEKVTVLSEITAKDAASGIAQVCKLTGDQKLVAEHLLGTISQKLVRKLCPKCREAYRPNPKLLQKVGLPEDLKVLYRKPRPKPPERGVEIEPCDVCGDIGYLGRIAMFEMIVMTDAMRELVASDPDPKKIKDQARKEQMLNLQADGLRLVEDGTTSLEELQRVFKEK